jgi:hypothetical protein
MMFIISCDFLSAVWLFEFLQNWTELNCARFQEFFLFFWKYFQSQRTLKLLQFVLWKRNRNQKEPTVFMKGTSGLFMQLFRNCDYIPFGGRVGGVLFLITVQEWYFLLVWTMMISSFSLEKLHEWKISYFLSVVEPVLAGYHIFEAHLRIPIRHIYIYIY